MHAVIAIAQGNCATSIRADEVSLHHVGRPVVGNQNTIAQITCDHIAAPDRDPSYGVVRRTDAHSGSITQSYGAGHVGADVVALEDVAAAILQLNSTEREPVD